MKRLVLMILFLSASFLGLAQSPEMRQKIETAKIALISERLGLSTTDAQKFWPLYNEYSQKRRANQIEFSQARRSYNKETATDKETKELLQLGRNVKEKQLKLESEYSDRMLEVIDPKQLMSLHNAEREFKKMLLDKLDQRRAQQQNANEQQRRQNNERMRNKRNN